MKRVDGFSGGRLTQAREARGLTKTTLSKMLGLSLTAVSDLEAARSLPKLETLEKLAAVTSFPEAFFLRPNPVSVNGPVFWRRQASEPLRSQGKTSQRISWAVEAFEALSEYLDFPSLQLPEFDARPDSWAQIDDEMIEALAERCRHDWGLGDYPIPDMALALENIGIPVLAFDIENAKQSGYTYWSHEIGRPIIGVNTYECTWTRFRFNLAHELGHALMHHGLVQENEVRHPQTYQLLERQAHRFAGALLFPRRAFLNTVRYPSLEEFAVHKQEWGISILAQIVRAEQLGVCDKDWSRSLFVKASKKGYRGKKGEPFDWSRDLEKPRMLRRAVDTLEESSELLLARVAGTLCLSRSEEVELFGRSLQPSMSNVIQLRAIE